MATEKWDASLYDAKHAFVWEKAKGVVELLAAKPDERILDLGCGTGTLTAEIAACGAHVVGVDRSSEMIHAARRKFPAIQFEVCFFCRIRRRILECRAALDSRSRERG